jgi:hypothetical protein
MIWTVFKRNLKDKDANHIIFMFSRTVAVKRAITATAKTMIKITKNFVVVELDKTRPMSTDSNLLLASLFGYRA